MNSLLLVAEPQQGSSGSDLSQKQPPLLKFHGKKTQKKHHQLINPNRQDPKMHICLYFCWCFWEFMTGKQGNQYPKEIVELTIPVVEVKWSGDPPRVKVELPHHHRKEKEKKGGRTGRSALDIWAESRKETTGRVESGCSSCWLPATPNPSAVAATRPSRAPTLAEWKSTWRWGVPSNCSSGHYLLSQSWPLW